MAVSEARKKANAKWDKENMTIIGCKVRKDYAARFREACAAARTTPNAVLKQAADAFMEAQGQQTPPHAAGDASQTDTPRPAHDGVSDEMRGAMDVLKAAAVAQIADASHEMRNASTEQGDETEARRTALLESIKGL